MNERKNGSIRTNTQRQREYSHSSKSRILAQHSGAVAQILTHLFEPNPTPGVPRLSLEEGGVAKSSQRSMAGFLPAHAGGDVLGYLVFEMKLNLII